MINKKTQKVLLQFWKVSRFPFFIAMAWAITSCYLAKEKDKTIINFIKDFITSFFFVMWFVGQYLRAEKDINDKSSYSELQTGIDEIKLTIENLGKAFTTTTTTTTKEPTISTENPMLAEATNAIDKGFVLAGLMQAGVAFEQSVIETAKQKQIQIDNRTTTAQLIYKLGKIYGQGIGDELFAVWKLRNQLVHLNSDAAKEIENSPTLIKYFEWAINYLENN